MKSLRWKEWVSVKVRKKDHVFILMQHFQSNKKTLNYFIYLNKNVFCEKTYYFSYIIFLVIIWYVKLWIKISPKIILTKKIYS